MNRFVLQMLPQPLLQLNPLIFIEYISRYVSQVLGDVDDSIHIADRVDAPEAVQHYARHVLEVLRHIIQSWCEDSLLEDLTNFKGLFVCASTDVVSVILLFSNQ